MKVLPLAMIAVFPWGWRSSTSERAIVPRYTSWCDSTPVVETPLSHGQPTMIVACSVTAADSLALRRVVANVARVMPLYATLTGVTYPWPRYVMRFDPASGADGGLSTERGAVFDNPLPNARTERDHPAVTAKIIMHELAHHWGKGAGGPAMGWLQEGWADFMSGQVWRADGGERAEEEYLFFYNTQWDDPSVYTQAPGNDLRTAQVGFPSELFSIPWAEAAIWEDPIANENAYYRGAIVLWMLQQYLGEARFWASMHALLTSTATGDGTDVLRQVIRTTTGEDLQWFFQQWIHGPGYPHVAVAAVYDAAVQQLTLHISQTTPLFRMPVTIRVGTTTGDTLIPLVVDSSTQTLVVPHLSHPPTMVVFDDRDAIVKTVMFPQPTAWLAEQVRREARPWQTWWALDQLRQRTSHDPAAAVALIAAARHGRYALTRAQALAALPPSAAPGVWDALMAGTHDTSVIVRRAAVYGLDGMRTHRADAVLADLAWRDSSDLVRGSATERLLMTPRVPAAERRALLAQLLAAPPSYQDVVLKGAITGVALADQCDSVMVSAIQGSLNLPATVSALQRVTDQLVPTFTAYHADPSCLQTIAALLPLSGASR